jgi:hypothetical protein
MVITKLPNTVSFQLELGRLLLQYTVKPVLRGHFWDKEKRPYKTGDLLKEVQFICNFLMTGQE